MPAITKRPPMSEEQVLLEELQNIERLAKALIEANQRLSQTAHPDYQFYAVRLGTEGLTTWREYVRTNHGITW